MKDKHDEQIPPENQRFIEVWEELKKPGNWNSDAALLRALGVKSRTAISEIRGGRPVPASLLEILKAEHNVSTAYVRSGILPKYVDPEDVDVRNDNTNNSTNIGQAIREAKAFGNNEDEGLITVPIGAQAGGKRYYDEPLYKNQLGKFIMPGLPFRGPKFRLFQAEGDSMQYVNEITGKIEGIKDGMWTIDEQIEPVVSIDKEGIKTSRWQIENFYVYVLVEDRRIRLKRLAIHPENKEGFVVISDNPEYPQEWIWQHEISELWRYRRKIDWDAAPPKMYDITVIPPIKNN